MLHFDLHPSQGLRQFLAVPIASLLWLLSTVCDPTQVRMAQWAFTQRRGGVLSAALQLLCPSVRQALHVGNATFNSGLSCEMHLINDVMVSYKAELAVLMDAYKVCAERSTELPQPLTGPHDVRLYARSARSSSTTDNWTSLLVCR